MEIITSNKLEKILKNPKKLVKEVGLETATKIKKRINELKASENFKEYLDNGIGKPHPLTGNLDNLYSVHIDKSIRLIIKPITINLDNESLKMCEKIEIKGVMDYHDGKNKWIIP